MLQAVGALSAWMHENSACHSAAGSVTCGPRVTGDDTQIGQGEDENWLYKGKTADREHFCEAQWLDGTSDLDERRLIRSAIREIRRCEIEGMEAALSSKRFRGARNCEQLENKENQIRFQRLCPDQDDTLEALSGKLQSIEDVDELTALTNPRGASEYEERKLIRAAIRKLRAQELEGVGIIIKQEQPGFQRLCPDQDDTLEALSGKLQSIEDVDELTVLLRGASEYEERKLIRAAIRKLRAQELEGKFSATVPATQHTPGAVDADMPASEKAICESRLDSESFQWRGSREADPEPAHSKADPEIDNLEERQRIRAQIRELRSQQNQEGALQRAGCQINRTSFPADAICVSMFAFTGSIGSSSPGRWVDNLQGLLLLSAVQLLARCLDPEIDNLEERQRIRAQIRELRSQQNQEGALQRAGPSHGDQDYTARSPCPDPEIDNLEERQRIRAQIRELRSQQNQEGALQRAGMTSGMVLVLDPLNKEEATLPSRQRLYSEASERELASRQHLDSRASDRDLSSRQRLDSGASDRDLSSRQRLDSGASDRDLSSRQRLDSGASECDLSSRQRLDSGASESDLLSRQRLDSRTSDRDLSSRQLLDSGTSERDLSSLQCQGSELTSALSTDSELECESRLTGGATEQALLGGEDKKEGEGVSQTDQDKDLVDGNAFSRGGPCKKEPVSQNSLQNGGEKRAVNGELGGRSSSSRQVGTEQPISIGSFAFNSQLLLPFIEVS
ncbi:UNVERIFIED_CONTAM: hypothetical protein FKN15_064978 [Acipenser sinensis]